MLEEAEQLEPRVSALEEDMDDVESSEEEEEEDEKVSTWELKGWRRDNYWEGMGEWSFPVLFTI